MTDDIFMGALSRRYPYPKLVELALKAGNDILSPSLPYSINSSLVRHIERLVTTGVISQARLDRSVRRILLLKQTYGLFNREPVPAATAAGWFQGPEVTARARRGSHEAVTVMRDSGGSSPHNCGPHPCCLYKWDFNQHLTRLLVSRNLAPAPRPCISVRGAPVPGRRVYAAAAGYDTVIYGGGVPPDIRALPASRYTTAPGGGSFHDPYWPATFRGVSVYGTFPIFPFGVAGS
jgi:hypothetical protein